MTTRTYTLAEQAQFIRLMCERTWGRDYEPGAETWLRLTAGEVEAFEKLASRLERMAPQEAEIKRIVQKKGRP